MRDIIRFTLTWLWIFYMFGCAAVPCKRAQVAIWKDSKEPTHQYKVTVRCHGDDGHEDIDVVKSRTKITGCKGE